MLTKLFTGFGATDTRLDNDSKIPEPVPPSFIALVLDLDVLILAFVNAIFGLFNKKYFTIGFYDSRSETNTGTKIEEKSE